VAFRSLVATAAKLQVAIHNHIEATGVGVDDETVDGYIFGQQRVVFDNRYGATHAILDVVKTFEPRFEINPSIAQGVDGIVRNTALVSQRQYVLWVNGGHPAIMMGDYADFFGA
jgi:hypothetical protein